MISYAVILSNFAPFLNLYSELQSLIWFLWHRIRKERDIHFAPKLDESQEVVWRHLNGLSFLKGLDADGYLTPLQILQTCKYQLRRLACSFPWLFLFDQISLSFEAFVVSIFVARTTVLMNYHALMCKIKDCKILPACMIA